MKKSHHLLAFAMTLAMVMPCSAQSIKSNMGILQSPNKKVTAWSKASPDARYVTTHNGNLLTEVNKAPKTTEGEQFTFKCNLISDESLWPETVIITSKTNPLSDRWYVYQDWETGEFVQNVPAGTYDVLVIWSGLETDGRYLVLKDNINVNGNIEVEINADEAKSVAIKAYHPNGDLLKTDKYAYDENWNQYLAEKGNVDGVFCFIDLVRKSDMFSIYSEMGLSVHDLYINDLGDDFIYIQNRAYYNEINEGCVFLNKFYMNGAHKFLENKPEDYYHHEDDFASSKIGATSEQSMGANFSTIYNGCGIQESGIAMDIESKINLWVNAPLEFTQMDESLDLLVRPTRNDFKKLNIMNFTDDEGNILESDTVPDWKKIFGPAMIVENGEKKYLFNGPSLDATVMLVTKKVDNYTIRPLYPGNETYSFTEEQKSSKFGDNTPINVFYQGFYFGDNEYYCAYLGRYGEYRSVDNEVLGLTLKANGEQITTVEGWEGPEALTYNNMNQYLASWGNPDRVKGVLDFEFDNQNIIVDGLQGRNLTTVHIDETAEDHFAPTMTMLQMRDVNGNVTDRFEKADGGIITFSCGDFDCLNDPVTTLTWFECKRPQVEAFFVANGQDNWMPLTFNENEEAYAPVAIGHIFNADLSQIEGEGWFDLKFKLSDDAGNTQEQIVSPAVRIGSVISGITGVKVGNATEVGRYTVDGRAISTPQSGVNIIKMSDGSVKKVWVK